nr:CBN-GLO-4 protein [Haemonchus contortus]
MVWDEPGVQDALSADEKLDILETWIVIENVNSIYLIGSGDLLEELEISYQIPGAALRSFGGNNYSKIRVWARCSHVEPAVVGVPASDCSACAEEWADMIRTTLGNESVGR